MTDADSSDSTDNGRRSEKKIRSGSESEYESQASGTDPASGDGDSLSSPPAMECSQHDKSNRRVVEVQVGPVRRRSDYSVFPGDYWVQGITRVLGEVHGEPCYEAELQDGLRVTVRSSSFHKHNLTVLRPFASDSLDLTTLTF